MKRYLVGLVLLSMLGVIAACAKPLAQGKVSELTPVESSYHASPNQVYYALRWALTQQGYPVGDEDLAGGTIATSWTPVTADSHFVAPFGVEDYGTTGAYHQLVIQVMPEGGKTNVAVRSRVKSVIYNLQSSQREEKALHKHMANYLRTHDVSVTNLGVQ